LSVSRKGATCEGSLTAPFRFVGGCERMDDGMLTGIMLVGLSALFGSYGVLTLVAAYRASDLTVWRRMAFVGGFSVLLSAFVGIVAATLLSQHLS
jgi:hypothetical protein